MTTRPTPAPTNGAARQTAHADTRGNGRAAGGAREPGERSRVLLGEMTWPEVAAARERAPLALLPVGACEQHGPHMALETDTARAEEFCVLLAQRLAPRAVVAPCLPVGVSEHHMAFAGTLTLSAVTLQQVLYEVGESLYRQGWRRLFILNGHGGNEPAIGVATGRLQAALPDLRIAYSGITPVVPDVARQLAVSAVNGHACEIETSQTLYLRPHLVRPDRYEAGALLPTADLPYAGQNGPGRVRFPQPFHLATANGALGDPRASTAEIGRELIERALDRLCEFLEAFLVDARAAAATAGTAASATADPVR
ncbi:MAG: Creatinine amidohydrolase [uncultured Chloroflexi bacterium]|uniref:Creatinine amidohydrolase n=1 Tax=uncultured Chloroflexota bacterium TaxID=166587 RepID=A0A6J4IPS0_9CHLR|nr:MAG: Creatinine amidohydrolase [uncultured Chloroflexota bacterium]